MKIGDFLDDYGPFAIGVVFGICIVVSLGESKEKPPPEIDGWEYHRQINESYGKDREMMIEYFNMANPECPYPCKVFTVPKLQRENIFDQFFSCLNGDER